MRSGAPWLPAKAPNCQLQSRGICHQSRTLGVGLGPGSQSQLTTCWRRAGRGRRVWGWGRDWDLGKEDTWVRGRGGEAWALSLAISPFSLLIPSSLQRHLRTLTWWSLGDPENTGSEEMAGQGTKWRRVNKRGLHGFKRWRRQKDLNRLLVSTTPLLKINYVFGCSES